MFASFFPLPYLLLPPLVIIHFYLSFSLPSLHLPDELFTSVLPPICKRLLPPAFFLLRSSLLLPTTDVPIASRGDAAAGRRELKPGRRRYCDHDHCEMNKRRGVATVLAVC